VRTSQIIQGALASGIALLSVVVLLMYNLVDIQADAPPPDTSVIQTMSLIQLVLACVLVFTAKIVYDMQFRPERLRRVLVQGLPNSQRQMVHLAPPQLCIALIRAAMIIRLAMYEGIALFGLVICLLAVVEGVMQAYPLYWLNVLSSLLVVGYIVLTFPNAQRIKMVFMEKIKRTAA
jgi:hypothetical protein